MADRVKREIINEKTYLLSMVEVNGPEMQNFFQYNKRYKQGVV